MVIIPKDNSDKLTGMIIEHNGKEICSEGSIFDRTPFPSTGELFMDINRFWGTLPESTQANIFRLYSEIEDAFRYTQNDMRLHERVIALVAELYACWSFADLSRFVRLHCNTLVPNEIQTVMGDYNSADRTYLRDDYVGLICLVTALRPMIPIWNLYVRESKKTSGTHFKEFMAMGLLNHTELIHTPEFEKLSTYVGMNVDNAKITMSAIVAGVGSAELESWVFGVVLIRKVCVGVVMHIRPDGQLFSSYNSSTNIVSNIFRQVETTLTSLDRKFDGQVRKKPDGMEYRDDDKESMAEKIIVKQPINDYKFLLAWKYAQSYGNARIMVDPSLPMEMVEACIGTLRQDGAFLPTDAQIALTQWAVNSALSARFIPALEQPERVNMMGLAQALYWHWGFYDLALLLTATPSVMNSNVVLGNETRSRVNGEQYGILREQYPYYHQRSGGKKEAQGQQRPENVAVIAIDRLFSLFDGRPYILNAPAELMALTTMRSYSSGGHLLPSDFKVQVANFIIKLNKHKSGV